MMGAFYAEKFGLAENAIVVVADEHGLTEFLNAIDSNNFIIFDRCDGSKIAFSVDRPMPEGELKHVLEITDEMKSEVCAKVKGLMESSLPSHNYVDGAEYTIFLSKGEYSDLLPFNL